MDHAARNKEEAFQERLFIFEDHNFDDAASQNSKNSNDSFKNEFYSQKRKSLNHLKKE